MKCPICKTKTRVLDSREYGKGMRRHRECPECLTRFHTTEFIVINTLDKHLKDKILNRFGTDDKR